MHFNASKTNFSMVTKILALSNQFKHLSYNM